MQTKISKWGNSLGLRLPKSILNELDLTVDTKLNVTQSDGKIILTPLKETLTMAELLEGMDKEGVISQHIKVEPIGKEKFWEEND